MAALPSNRPFSYELLLRMLRSSETPQDEKIQAWEIYVANLLSEQTRSEEQQDRKITRYLDLRSYFFTEKDRVAISHYLKQTIALLFDPDLEEETKKFFWRVIEKEKSDGPQISDDHKEFSEFIINLHSLSYKNNPFPPSLALLAFVGTDFLADPRIKESRLPSTLNDKYGHEVDYDNLVNPDIPLEKITDPEIATLLENQENHALFERLGFALGLSRDDTALKGSPGLSGKRFH